MRFESPWWLLLVVVVGPMVVLAMRSRAPLDRRTLFAVVALQVVAVLAAVVALADPWRLHRGNVHRIAIWAGEVDAAGAQAVRDWRSAAAWAEPFQVVRAGAEPVVGARQQANIPDASGTPDVAAALQAAALLVPAGARAEVALFHDGRHDGAELAAAQRQLAQRGIALTLHGRVRAAPATVLAAVQVPARVAPGEAFVLQANVRAVAPAKARLEVRHGDAVVGAADVTLRAGSWQLPVDVVLTRSGVQRLQVTLVIAGSHEPATGLERCAVLVDDALHVLHLTADASRRQALAATLMPHGIAVTAPAPDAAMSSAQLAAHTVVLVDELAAEAWPAATQQLVAEAVTNSGLGLVLAGTHANLGPGGYGSSPLQDLLPVRMPQREERRDPSVALVLIIDTSGSMGGGRIELAKEVARLCVQKLQPHDKVGIVEFYGSKRWAAPLQPATNTIEITRALNRLQAGGGTIIYDALEESYYALLSAHARFQHALVLTDGGVESGPFEALARRMAAAGQTVSTVLIGPQANSPFLLSLAQWGRGRFYSCPDRFQLPDLQFREPQSALLPAVREQPTPLWRAADSEVVAAFAGDDLPPTGGLVEASVRVGAEVLLRTATDEPFLVGWDQGAGRVLTMAGQLLGPASGALRADAAYGAFVADLLRSAASGARAWRPVLTLTSQEAGVRAELAVPSGSTIPGQVTLATGDSRRLPMIPCGGDRFAAFVPWRDGEAQQFVVQAGELQLAAGAACPPHSRSTRATVDPATWSSLALAGTAAGEHQAERFARGLTWVALVAFVLSILVRRLPWDALPRLRRSPSLLLLALASAMAGPAFAQQPVPPSDEAAIAAAIGEALRTRGDLEPLATAWRDASPMHRYRLARVQGDLEGATRVLAASDLPIRDRELPALLEVLGRPKAALAALGEPPAEVAERVDWLFRRAGLKAAARDVDGAVADLGAAVAARPECADRAGLLAAAIGAIDPALQWHRGDGVGKDAFQTGLRRTLWLQRAGRFDEAATAAEAAFGQAPLQRDRFFALAWLVAARRAAGQLPQLVDAWLLRARGVGTPLSPAELRVLCDVLRELGRAAEGLDLVRSLADEQRVALADVELALAIDAGDPAAVIAQLRARLQARPGDAQVRGSLALLLADEQQEAEAERTLTADLATAAIKDLRARFQSASELALEGAVTAIAAAVAAHGEPGAGTEAALLQAGHHRRQNRDAQAVQVLLAAQAQAVRPADRLRLAEQLESLGRKPEAIALYGAIWDELHTEDLGLRLAWLLSESKDEADRARAQQIFRAIWTTAGSAARRVQAEEHVLDLAAREGTLADLAIELEGKLADPALPERVTVRDALIKIYTRARDTTGAAALLQQWAKAEPEHAIDAHAQLARVYLAAEEFRNHERTLEHLLTIDPVNELDYRQQLAMSALERGRPEQARRYLRGLLDRPGAPDQVALEFAAGIYALAAEHDEAVRMYRRALAMYPDRVETWLLLGNALRAAGQRERAIGVFLDLLLQPLPDDLFVVAVDGLLNMEAPAASLAAADRLTLLRLTARPDQVFLHRLRQDLQEALGDDRARLQALEDAAVVGGEQRAAFVRELMQEAETRRDWRTHALHGRTLLLLGDELPPAVFLALGEALLRSGELDAAARAFQRARLAPDFAAVEARTAAAYESQDRLAEAERVRRRVLRRRPDDQAAMLAVARLCERQGRPEQALPLFSQVVLALLPKELAAAPPARMAGTPGPAVALLGTRGRTIDGQDFAEPFAGVLRCAHTVAELQPVVDALLVAATPVDGASQERASKALALLRRVALATADPALRTTIHEREAALLTARAADDRLRQEILSRRLQAGELALAALAVPHGKANADVLRLQLLNGDFAALRTAAAQAAPGLLPDLARALLACGQRGEAEALLTIADAATGEDSLLAAEDLRRLFGLPFDAQARGRRQLDKALARGGALPARATAILAAMTAAGTPPQERAAHVRELAAQAIAAPDAVVAERLLDQADADLDDDLRGQLVERLFGKIDNAYQVGQRARHLGAVPVERARELLATALRRFDADDRRQQYLTILRSPGALPEAHLQAVVAALDLDQLSPINRIWLAQIGRRSQLPSVVQQALVARLLARQGHEPSVRLLATRLLPTPAERAASAAAALRQFAGQKDDGERDETAFAGLAGLLDVAAARALLAGLPPTGGSVEVRLALLLRVGDKDAYADLLLAAMKQRPEDTGLSYRAAQFLEQDGRLAQAAEAFRSIRARSATFYPYQAAQLARLELRLGDPLAAIAALRASDDRLGSNYRLFLQAIASLPDATQRRALLQYLGQQRAASGRSLVIFRSPREDALTLRLADVLAEPTWPSLVPTAATEGNTAVADHDLLALMPEGEDVARSLLRTLDAPGRDADPGLYRGWLGSARQSGRADGLLAEALAQLDRAPGDAEALRVVQAAVQIGMTVPDAAMRAALRRVASEPRLSPAVLVTFLPAIERAGDEALADAITTVVLQRPRNDAALAPWLPALYARACQRLPAAVVAAAAPDADAVRPTVDEELLAAAVLAHPDPAAVHAAMLPAFTRVRAAATGLIDHQLQLAWGGLLLRLGEVDAALQMLAVEEDDVLLGPAVSARAYAAAIPPLGLWAVPAATTKVADAMVAAVASSGDDGRAIAARLGAVLAARLAASGRDADAAELRTRLRTAAAGLAIRLAEWQLE
ncbi:MAG: VWA domain-containing protein [Planctomycetes bacterium]|nr:VWA domain-containing protein [Planctomycetota bacterium]